MSSERHYVIPAAPRMSHAKKIESLNVMVTNLPWKWPDCRHTQAPAGVSILNWVWTLQVSLIDDLFIAEKKVLLLSIFYT